MLDILIQNGTVIDGSGACGFEGYVLSPEGQKEIENAVFEAMDSRRGVEDLAQDIVWAVCANP